VAARGRSRINEHIGHRPIASFGNSDGDLQMLQWTMGRRWSALRPPRALSAAQGRGELERGRHPSRCGRSAQTQTACWLLVMAIEVANSRVRTGSRRPRRKSFAENCSATIACSVEASKRTDRFVLSSLQLELWPTTLFACQNMSLPPSSFALEMRDSSELRDRWCLRPCRYVAVPDDESKSLSLPICSMMRRGLSNNGKKY
jgi:hypothetical protein